MNGGNRVVRMLEILVVTAGVGAMLAAFVVSLPDIARYLKIRSM